MKPIAATLSASAFALLAFSGVYAADAPRATPVDALFARSAAQMNAAEIELGEHAAKNATTPAVKAFAQKMVDDHKAAGDKLKAIADDMKLDLPSDPDGPHAKFKDALEDLKGADYEQAYVQAMVTDHGLAVALFEDEAKNGNNAQLQQFAQETLPTLKAHQTEAIGLEKGGTAGGAESGAANK